MSIKIAISGSAGTGKSTLAEAVANRLGLPYLDESYRRRREEGLDPHSLTRTQHRDLILDLYDDYISAVERAHTDHGGCVADRSPVDFFAFWLHYGFWDDEGASDEFAHRYLADARTFDLTVVLPWGSFPLAGDGVRSTNTWLQLKYQALLEGLTARAHLKTLWIRPDTADLETRISLVLSEAGG